VYTSITTIGYNLEDPVKQSLNEVIALWISLLSGTFAGWQIPVKGKPIVSAII